MGSHENSGVDLVDITGSPYGNTQISRKIHQEMIKICIWSNIIELSIRITMI